MANLHLPRALIPAMVAMVVALTVGCASNGPASGAPRVRVSTQPFALAEVTRRVGLGRVVLVDHGDVVVTSDGGSGAWLDPVAMEGVTDRVAATLAAADPAGRGAYETAARAFRAQLGALDINYRSSLADCGRRDLVTADRAFAPMAARYNFVDHAATDAGIADLVRTKGVPVVFTEPGVETTTVEALAGTTHARVDQLDSLAVRTTEEAARGATYLSLMADNLAKLRTALACTTS